ncbi:alpha/beta fold hydrolase [Variovorax terrae]|uniref:Alpha/beta fold hydrolase n=1 Tax=Variovorax terrae TaxID=2923278 RepID=A0A9X2APP5_9BURK|nr:alpha/beta fold hydrolase [Variovorax terrae]MCJ0762261.1 alpha/beta fold hydrolase [Variovorax terrae]
MIPNDFYSPSVHGTYALYELGDLLLEEGETLRSCKLAYRTHGMLNAAKDNAVLVTTWFSGTGKVMEDVYVGAGHALDPAKYFIVIVDQIGSGLSSSPHNTPSPQNMANFPKVRIGDDVVAQHQLLTREFGIKRLALAFGGSMGGQQIYEWAVRYPEMVQRAAVLAATARNTFHDFMFTETLIESVTSDPAWKNGWYARSEDVRDGLSRLAKIFAVMGWSTEFYEKKRWNTLLGMSSERDFINGVMRAYFAPMDANDLLCKAWKWQRGDVSRHTGGDLAAALGRIRAKVYTMPISHDMFFPPRDCEAESRLIPNGELRVIDSIEGHMALNGFDPAYTAQVDAHQRELLAFNA